MIERRQNVDSAEKAILVGVVQKGQTEAEVQENLDELAFLAETAGALSQKRFIQKLAKPDSRSFIGKGKLEEIKAYLANHEARVIIFDDELSGSQITHIEEVLDVKTIDRSARARSECDVCSFARALRLVQPQRGCALRAKA